MTTTGSDNIAFGPGTLLAASDPCSITYINPYRCTDELNKDAHPNEWLCPYCQSYNDIKTFACLRCGAPKSKSEVNR